MSLEISDLVAGDLEVIARGFTYAEGPVWDPSEGTLLFNDIPADTTYRVQPPDAHRVERHPTDFANGMALDLEGRLLVCQSAANRLVRFEKDGSLTIRASHFDGQELNSPNDLVVRSNGDVYFTDPAYGRIPVYGQDRPQQLDFQAVYRVRDDSGELEMLEDDFGQPNGICFSPDQRLAYVADTERANISVFRVDEDGLLTDRAIFQEPVGPRLSMAEARANDLPSGYVDGLKCDALGNVYVTGPGGIVVFGSDGTSVGVIGLPEDAANFAWGGPDGRSLFVCCRTFVGRIPMHVQGAAGVVDAT